MDRKLKAKIAAVVADIGIDADGMTLLRFATAARLDPRGARDAARYLHRKRIVWMSERKGRVTIYPATKRPGRGRPRLEHNGPAPELLALLASAHPFFYLMKLIHETTPPGTWRDQPELRAEIAHNLAVEAANVMALCQRFISSHRAFPVADMREALWRDQPQMMEIVVKTQPHLALGDRPIPLRAEPQRKKITANLSDDERVMKYVERAGPNGIGAYEIANKTGGKITRKRVDEIAESLENMGLVHTAVARTAARGRKGLRLFAASHGQPNINESGRVIPE